MSPETRSTEPLVSVVIPTHYRNERLRAAIDSVRRQTYDPVELVVVDDSGEEHARNVVPEEATYIGFEANRGANAARTAGIRQASGKYVQLLDDDDRLRPAKLRRCCERLESNPNVGVAYCGMTYDGGTSVHPRAELRGSVLDSALAFDMMPCLTSTMLIDASVLTTVIPLADRPGADDLGLMIELATRTEFDFVDEVLVERGRPETSRGRSMGVVDGRKEILREYDDLYGSAPSWVRKRALSDTYRTEASIRINARKWSPRAIRAYALAVRYDPSMKGFARLAASFFGRPGIDALHYVGDRLADG